MKKIYLKYGLFLVTCLSLLVYFKPQLLSHSAKASFEYNPEKKVVIFDIGGVLTKTNRNKAFGLLNKKEVSAYYLYDWKNPEDLRLKVYNIIDTTNSSKNTLVKDAYGDYLPYSFCQILKGEKTEKDVLNHFCNQFENGDHSFYNQREKNLCYKIAHIMFDSQTIVDLQDEAKEFTQLLHECLKKDHYVFLFSNYSKDGFKKLKNKFPHIFAQIPEQNIIVSAEIKSVKPEQSAYQALIKQLKKYNIVVNHETCFFLDDQEENITAGKKFNLTGIHIKNNNHKSVRRKMKQYNIL